MDAAQASVATSSAASPFQLLLDLRFRPLPGDGQLLDHQGPGGVEHPALTERQVLRALEAEQVAIDLRHVEERARLDLLHEAAVPAVPRLLVDVDVLVAQHVED